MITFTEEQLASFTPEEREMVNNLAKRNFVAVPDPDDEEKKRLDEERQRVKDHVKAVFDKQKDNENYAKWMESQFDNNGHSTVTQYF